MPHEAHPLEAVPSLDAKVAFLRRCDSYPDRPAAVEAKETHMSWVFLTRDFVYKLKKPIHRGTLDYRTLDARRLNCRREVDLNRRMAADVYLGVVALALDAEGRLHLDGSGRIVEWLVRMRRLPEQRTLEHAILAGRIDEADVRRVATRLVAFFRATPVCAIAADDYRRRLETLVRDTHDALRRPAFGLALDRVDRVFEAQLNFLTVDREMIGGRASHIVEGHGDLRPEHVYLGDEPIIMDCLEFDRDLRLLDPADDLAFLAMECERLGAPIVGTWLLSTYCAATGDAVAPALFDFYACCRAGLRARLAIWHLDEPEVREAHKWRRRTDQYLALADEHARKMISVHGAPASAMRGSAPSV